MMNPMKRAASLLLITATLCGCAMSVAPGEGDQKISDASQESLDKQFVTGTATRDDVAIDRKSVV